MCGLGPASPTHVSLSLSSEALTLVLWGGAGLGSAAEGSADPQVAVALSGECWGAGVAGGHLRMGVASEYVEYTEI